MAFGMWFHQWPKKWCMMGAIWPIWWNDCWSHGLLNQSRCRLHGRLGWTQGIMH